MTVRDFTAEQPERFNRAVRAACEIYESAECSYPACKCETWEAAFKAGIIAWEQLPTDGECAQDRKEKWQT